MTSLLAEFRAGTRSAKLSIISDVLTVTSVVLASLLIPALTLAFKAGISIESVAAISALVLLTVALTAVCLTIFLALHAWLGRVFKRPLFVALWRLALWCFAAIAAIIASVVIYSLITTTHWS